MKKLSPLPGFETRTSQVPSRCATIWALQAIRCTFLILHFWSYVYFVLVVLYLFGREVIWFSLSLVLWIRCNGPARKFWLSHCKLPIWNRTSSTPNSALRLFVDNDQGLLSGILSVYSTIMDPNRGRTCKSNEWLKNRTYLDGVPEKMFSLGPTLKNPLLLSSLKCNCIQWRQDGMVLLPV